MNKSSTLETMIEEIISQVFKEANPVIVSEETPLERKRRLRQKFASKTTPPSNSFNPTTEEGRENIIDYFALDFGDVGARINIINKLGQGAADAENRQDFKANLIQMFDNLEKLQNRDLPKLLTKYVKVANMLGLSFSRKAASGLSEVDMNPDSPEGRKNLISKVLSEVQKMNQLIGDARKLLFGLRNVTSVPVFKNEIKLIGEKIGKFRSHLISVNSAFVETFQEYEKQRGRPSNPGV